VALWVDLAGIHRGHHADSLLPVLVSLLRWTPYYWEQDRFGMLVPLLAYPYRNPLTNLLVQDFLDLACGLAAFVLLARYALRGDPAAPAVGLLGAAALLGLTPPVYKFMYLVDASYGVWLTLGLGSVLLADNPPGASQLKRRARTAGGLVLSVLAHWVNFTTAVLLAPLVVLRHLAFWRNGASTGETVRALAVLGAGYAAGAGLMRLSPEYHRTPYGTVEPSLWPGAWWRLLVRQAEALRPPWYPALLAALLLAGVAALASPRLRRHAGPYWRAAAALGGAAAVAFGVVGTLKWASMNDYTFRYLAPPLVLVQAGLWSLAAGPALAALGEAGRRRAWAASAGVLLASAAAAYGLPSPAGVRRDIDQKLGALTDDLIAARCTHLTGDYWNVWPAVFHANLVLHERGEDRTLWGVTHRSEPTRVLWQSVPRDAARFAIPLGDPAGDSWLRSFQLPPMAELERRRTVRVLAPAGGREGER
jgi:hypothetical protein